MRPEVSAVPTVQPLASSDGAAVSAKLAGPEIASATVTATSTGTSLPFGGHSADGVAAHVIVGAVASRRITTDADHLPPSLVAVHANVVPVVSSVTSSVPQPDV